MKTIKRIFELMCAAASEVVPAAEHLCQCAKCSCNFDKSKAKSSDAGYECPNCGTLLDEKGAAKVEDQAAKEKAKDGKEIVAATDAGAEAGLEAGGPGSGPRPGQHTHAVFVDGGLHSTHPNEKEAKETRDAIIEKDTSNGKPDVKVYKITKKMRMEGFDGADAARQPALEASNPEGVNQWSKTAGELKDKSLEKNGLKGAKFENTPEYLNKWASHHEGMAEHHEEELRMQPTDLKERAFHEDALEMHDKAALNYGKAARALASGDKDKANFHLGRAERYSIDSKNAKPAASLQAGYNGNQHQSSKELAAEHSVAADTASKVAASASKAARNQDPSNKEGMHDHALTMHTAAKSLHELAAQKHRSAGEEDCAKDHDDAAAGHGDEMQAHKGVIEACGGMAARDYSGVLGLEASNPEGINQWSKSGRAYALTVKANQSGKSADHDEAAAAHGEAEKEASQMAKETNGNKWFENAARQHGLLKADHLEKSKALKPYESRDATPAAGLQLDCSACVEAKNFKSILNPIADGITMYMPGGTHEITPSQNGRAVTVTVEINAAAAEKLEAQRKLLEASGKKPFFSVQHSTQIAAFWPQEFFWDTRLDATGSLVEGVWARGEWTRAGREAVEGKDFRTFSPTFFVDAIRNDPNRPVQVVCNDEAKANMGALENDPAFQTISPLWAHDASAAGTPKPKPEGVTTEKLIVMVHDELRASNPDLQDVVNAISYKYDMRVTANDVARALRGEALEAGGPGSGPRPGVATNKASEHLDKRTAFSAKRDKAESPEEKNAAGASSDAHQASAQAYTTGEKSDHRAAYEAHHAAARLHQEASRNATLAGKDGGEHMTVSMEHLGHAVEHSKFL